MSQRQSTFGLSAYGGEGWSPRSDSMATELGGVWRACGIDSEWRTLRAVLLHRPGSELEVSNDPNDVQILRGAREHQGLARQVQHQRLSRPLA